MYSDVWLLLCSTMRFIHVVVFNDVICIYIYTVIHIYNHIVLICHYPFQWLIYELFSVCENCEQGCQEHFYICSSVDLYTDFYYNCNLISIKTVIKKLTPFFIFADNFQDPSLSHLSQPIRKCLRSLRGKIKPRQSWFSLRNLHSPLHSTAWPLTL